MDQVKTITVRTMDDLKVAQAAPPETKLRCFKFVSATMGSPIHGGLTYEVGKEVKPLHPANTDPNEGCGSGIHVATLEWLSKEIRESRRLLVLECTRADVACFPHAGEGKFRLHRAVVVKELKWLSRGYKKAQKDYDRAVKKYQDKNARRYTKRVEVGTKAARPFDQKIEKLRKEQDRINARINKLADAGARASDAARREFDERHKPAPYPQEPVLDKLKLKALKALQDATK